MLEINDDYSDGIINTDSTLLITQNDKTFKPLRNFNDLNEDDDYSENETTADNSE